MIGKGSVAKVLLTRPSDSRRRNIGCKDCRPSSLGKMFTANKPVYWTLGRIKAMASVQVCTGICCMKQRHEAQYSFLFRISPALHPRLLCSFCAASSAGHPNQVYCSLTGNPRRNPMSKQLRKGKQQLLFWSPTPTQENCTARAGMAFVQGIGLGKLLQFQEVDVSQLPRGQNCESVLSTMSKMGVQTMKYVMRSLCSCLSRL